MRHQNHKSTTAADSLPPAFPPAITRTAGPATTAEHFAASVPTSPTLARRQSESPDLLKYLRLLRFPGPSRATASPLDPAVNDGGGGSVLEGHTPANVTSGSLRSGPSDPGPRSQHLAVVSLETERSRTTTGEEAVPAERAPLRSRCGGAPLLSRHWLHRDSLVWRRLARAEACLAGAKRQPR